MPGTASGGLHSLYAESLPPLPNFIFRGQTNFASHRVGPVSTEVLRMPPWAKERGQGRDHPCGGGDCPGMKRPACLRGFTRAGGPVRGSGIPRPAAGSAAGAPRLLLRRGRAPSCPAGRRCRPAPPARPSALPERQREFPARKCGGPGAGAEAAQAGAGRVPSPVGRAGRRGKSPRGARRRHAVLHGAALRDRRRHSATRRRRRQLCPGEPQAAPGPPLAAFFLSCLPSSPRCPPGCAPSVPQQRDGSRHLAGLGWAAPGAPVCRGRLCPVQPRACALGAGRDCRGCRLQPARGAGGMPALLPLCYRGLPGQGRDVPDSKMNEICKPSLWRSHSGCS